MSDGFDVDPDAILEMSQQLGDSIEPMTKSAGDVPHADAGIMTPVVEKAVTALLEAIGGYACRVADLGESIERSALNYHREDLEQQSSLAQLMLQLSPAEADAQVADDPDSEWGRLLAEERQKWEQLYALPGDGEAPPTLPQTGDALDDLLLGPLQTEGEPHGD